MHPSIQSQIRAAVLAVAVVPVLAIVQPACAQISGGVGSSNAANQSFQQQNALRGVQQQQTFNNNQINAQQRTNQLYDNSNTASGPGGFAPRRSR
jgi:hypothetical protein